MFACHFVRDDVTIGAPFIGQSILNACVTIKETEHRTRAGLCGEDTSHIVLAQTSAFEIEVVLSKLIIRSVIP